MQMSDHLPVIIIVNLNVKVVNNNFINLKEKIITQIFKNLLMYSMLKCGNLIPYCNLLNKFCPIKNKSCKS